MLLFTLICLCRAWKEHALLYHDITELRRRALHSLAVEFGEEEYVDRAIEVRSCTLHLIITVVIVRLIEPLVACAGKKQFGTVSL